MAEGGKCAFCGKRADEVKLVCSGKQICICNECIVLSATILLEEDEASGFAEELADTLRHYYPVKKD